MSGLCVTAYSTANGIRRCLNSTQWNKTMFVIACTCIECLRHEADRLEKYHDQQAKRLRHSSSLIMR